MKDRFTRFAMLVLPALVLAACGGGGGGGGGGGSSSNASTTTFTPTLAISSTNASSVAADGLDASTNAGAAQAGANLITGVQVDAGTPVMVPSLSEVALKLARMAAGKAPSLATGVAVNETDACTYGGTITITGNIASDTSVSAGDTISISASNCAEVIGNSTSVTTLNGAMAITVTAGTISDSAVYPQNITMALTATSLSTSTLGVVDVSDGDMTIALQQISATAANATISGNSLTNTWTHGSVTRSVALKNYKIAQGTNGTTVRSDVTATVVTTNPRVGSNQVYTVTTPTPIVRDLAIVASGSLKVTGASSSLLLTVTTPNNFTLQVDANGDGTYESSSTVTMADLQGLL